MYRGISFFGYYVASCLLSFDDVGMSIKQRAKEGKKVFKGYEELINSY